MVRFVLCTLPMAIKGSGPFKASALASDVPRGLSLRKSLQRAEPRFVLCMLPIIASLGCGDSNGQPPKRTARPSRRDAAVTRPPVAAKRPETKTDVAIRRGLEYLAKDQQKSGAWRITAYGESSAGTSLAVMAFLAAGHVPGKGPYGKRLNRAIDFVLDHQQPVDRRKGREMILLLARRSPGPMYSHGISTLMLAKVAEHLNGDREKRVHDVLQKAIRLIIKSQEVPKPATHKGGWRYQPSSRDSDLSVTGWQLAALHAAKEAGFEIPQEHLDNAVAYVKKCVAARGGGFAYQPRGSASATRTGIGILSLERCGEHRGKQTLAAADYLLKRPLRFSDRYFYYGVYYCTAGMSKVGGKYWNAQKTSTRALLLPRQADDGSWSGRTTDRRYGRAYCTSLAVMALAQE